MFPFSYIKFHLFKKKFRKLNSHNFTQIMNYCDLSKVVVGKKTYGEIHVTDYSPADTKLYIGSYCSIAPNVRFLLGGEHQLYSVSTYPFKVLFITKLLSVLKRAETLTIIGIIWSFVVAINCVTFHFRMPLPIHGEVLDC